MVLPGCYPPPALLTPEPAAGTGGSGRSAVAVRETGGNRMIWTFQLTFDCGDPVALAGFWHATLGYGPGTWADDNAGFIEAHPDLVARQSACDDPQGRHLRIYLQRVPEPKTTPNRIRPEIVVPAAGYPDEARRWEDRDGRRLTDHARRDPEGNEVEVRLVPDGDRPRLSAVVVDAVDPARLAAFWAEAFGSDVVGGTGEVGETVAPEVAWPASPPALRFAPGGGPKPVKNRLHLDLTTADVDDLRGEADRLVGAGATLLHPSDIGYRRDEWPDDHRVLRDPEGNELCLQAPPA